MSTTFFQIAVATGRRICTEKQTLAFTTVRSILVYINLLADFVSAVHYSKAERLLVPQMYYRFCPDGSPIRHIVELVVEPAVRRALHCVQWTIGKGNRNR